MDDKLLKSIAGSLKSIDLSLKKIERNTRPLDPELSKKKKGRSYGVNPIVRLEGDPKDVLVKVEEGLLQSLKKHQGDEDCIRCAGTGFVDVFLGKAACTECNGHGKRVI